MVPLPVRVGVAHHQENHSGTDTTPEVAIWEKQIEGRMIEQNHLAVTSLGVVKRSGLARATGDGVEQFGLLATRRPLDRLSPQEPRRNKQLPRGLCLLGHSIEPMLERLDPYR